MSKSTHDTWSISKSTNHQAPATLTNRTANLVYVTSLIQNPTTNLPELCSRVTCTTTQRQKIGLEKKTGALPVGQISPPPACPVVGAPAMLLSVNTERRRPARQG